MIDISCGVTAEFTETIGWHRFTLAMWWSAAIVCSVVAFAIISGRIMDARYIRKLRKKHEVVCRKGKSSDRR